MTQIRGAALHGVGLAFVGHHRIAHRAVHEVAIGQRSGSGELAALWWSVYEQTPMLVPVREITKGQPSSTYDAINFFAQTSVHLWMLSEEIPCPGEAVRRCFISLHGCWFKAHFWSHRSRHMSVGKREMLDFP